MDDKITLEEKSPEPPPSSGPRKLTAPEARKKYGIRSLILTALLVWFSYDGWFNQDPKMMEHQSFNRVGAVLLAIGLVYSLIMFISAALTCRREQQQQPPQL
jgi:hypothetical protein